MTEEELQIFDELNHPPGKYVFFSSTHETKFITNIKRFFFLFVRSLDPKPASKQILAHVPRYLIKTCIGLN